MYQIVNVFQSFVREKNIDESEMLDKKDVTAKFSNAKNMWCVV